MRKLSLIILLMMACINSYAMPINPDRAIRAILGEARGEGFVSMQAHATGIRNRGNLAGVYGLHQIKWKNGLLMSRNEKEVISPELYHLASKAWYTSEFERIHRGNHWLSDYDKKHRRNWRHWIKDFTPVYRIGTTTFYTEKRS